VTELDSLVTALRHTDPSYLYFTIFFIAFLENLFPPAPSDLVIAFGGSLVGIGKLSFGAALVSATLGSTVGFIVMYFVGFLLGKKLIDAGRPRFLPFDKIKVVEKWFTKYGYWLVVMNRFLSGTRAVISFFVGLSELPVAITLPLCAISALLWNSILLYGGYMLGHNWRTLDEYLTVYGIAVLVVILGATSFFIVRFILRRKNA
jgi:membrane protein DedA with SNARE-associated domain